MAEISASFRDHLRRDLRHRLSPMTGRDPAERGRSATPLELLYDLIYVIAFGAAAEQLARYVSSGQTAPALGAFAFVIFSITLAWKNFTWFTSAYGNDDALQRVATIVQMVGVVLVTFGLPVSFEDAAHGQSPNNLLIFGGFVIIRVPLAALWLRAARNDPSHRRISIAYAVMIGVAQLGWAVTAIPGVPVVVAIPAIVVLAAAEMIAPVVAERTLGPAPWNAGHIAERFSLLALITLGEVVAATTSAVGALTQEQGWSAAAVAIAASGVLITAALWWAYFLVPSRTMLEECPERTYAWRFAQLPIFGAIAAVGAGLHVATNAVEHQQLSVAQVAFALTLPVGVVILLIFVSWSVLMRSYDLTHIPLLLVSFLPLIVAVLLGLAADHDRRLDLHNSADTMALVAVIALVAVSCVVEVIGHELVGYAHTVRALEEGS